jgi:hypothetical protein
VGMWRLAAAQLGVNDLADLRPRPDDFTGRVQAQRREVAHAGMRRRASRQHDKKIWRSRRGMVCSWASKQEVFLNRKTLHYASLEPKLI